MLRKQVEQVLCQSYDKLYRLAYSYVQNEADALDIVQESAYKVIRQYRQVKEHAFLSTWIYRIVIHTSLDVLRKRKKENLLPMDVEPEYEAHYEDMDVMQALATLEEKDRTVLVLRYFEEWKIADIAKLLEENQSTIKSRLYRALKKCKIVLTEEGAE